MIRTAEFYPIEIFVRHGIDEVTHSIGKHQFCLRLQTVCGFREDSTRIKSGRDYEFCVKLDEKKKLLGS